MMTHKQSGWQGKLKVAAAVICTTAVSLILLQCNARLEDAENPAARNASNITLPQLPENSYAFRGDLSNVVKLTIAKDNLTVNGEPIPLEELAQILEKGKYNDQVAIHLSIDKDQSMGFVRAVEMELRKADRRKILYVGQTNTGTMVEIPLILPPSPEDAARMGLVIPDIAEAEAAGTTDILKIKTGDRTESINQQVVYDFVQRHIHKQSSDYVVSFVYEDDDIYNDYLRNMASIKEAFNTIYQERALKMFGKDYASLDKEENAAVRSGVPTAISVAEKSL